MEPSFYSPAQKISFLVNEHLSIIRHSSTTWQRLSGIFGITFHWWLWLRVVKERVVVKNYDMLSNLASGLMPKVGQVSFRIRKLPDHKHNWPAANSVGSVYCCTISVKSLVQLSHSLHSNLPYKVLHWGHKCNLMC